MTTKKNQILDYSILNHFDVGQFQKKETFPYTQFSDLLIKEKYELVEVLENDPTKDEGHNYQGTRYYFVIRNNK